MARRLNPRASVALLSLLFILASLRLTAFFEKWWLFCPGNEGMGDVGTATGSGSSSSGGSVSSTATDDVNVKNSGSSSAASRTNITEIMRSTKTDKLWSHRYDHYYTRWLAPYRDLPVKFLEIGADKGLSLRLWSEYFSAPELIVGLAYGPTSEGVEEKVADLDAKNVVVVRGDQGSKETMDALARRGPWDVIVDDGSHYPPHMVFSLFSLFQFVKPGGMYVLEDLETNYWRPGTPLYGYQMEGTGIASGPETSAVAKIKQLVDVLNRYPLGVPDKLSIMPGDHEVCELSFGMNLLMLRKCNEAEMEGRPEVKQHVSLEIDEVDAWVREAKRTNPEGFK